VLHQLSRLTGNSMQIIYSVVSSLSSCNLFEIVRQFELDARLLSSKLYPISSCELDVVPLVEQPIREELRHNGILRSPITDQSLARLHQVWFTRLFVYFVNLSLDCSQRKKRLIILWRFPKSRNCQRQCPRLILFSDLLWEQDYARVLFLDLLLA